MRVNVNKVVNATDMRTNMCNEWLIVSYDDQTEKEDGFGSHRFLEWSDRLLFTKILKNGCQKIYTAECEEGQLKVHEVCPDGKGNFEGSVNFRCLGGFGCMGAVGGRKSILGSEDEKLILELPGSEEKTIISGKVVVWTVDPDKGIDLEDAPGKYEWKAETGCYCCKRNYGVLGLNPFSASNGRHAWDRADTDGNMECMLAWRMTGNFVNHENPVNTSAAAMFAMIPEAFVTFVDTLTLTTGRHLACASTCPFRKVEYAENQYSFTKIQTDLDKY
jgi:hypothetical protein